MKRLIAAAMSLGLMVSLSSALAGSAGTSSDPLITKSYAEDTYTASVMSDGRAAVDEKLRQVYYDSAEELTSSANAVSGFRSVVVPEGETVRVGTGCSVILTYGSAELTETTGTVIKVDGAVVADSGARISANARYFCAENTQAVYTALEDSTLMVDGAYSGSEGVSDAFTLYADVAPYDWYYESAVFAYNIKLFPDYASSRFRPTDGATRAEMVYALWVAAGQPESENTVTFQDLTQDWYREAVAWSVEKGIIQGFNPQEFSPDTGLTREQLAVIMYRYTQAVGGDVSAQSELDKFTDASLISDWARDEMEWAYAVGILTGMSATEMSPQTTAQRDHTATVLMRYVAGQELSSN